MPKVALAFFTVAPIYGLVGMVWGAVMGATEDHTMMPAHAHLNLLGLVLMAIMGTFYALAGQRVSQRLAWANFGLSNLGVLLMIPALTVILGGDQSGIPIIMAGQAFAILGVVVFLLAVVSLWKAPPAAA